MDNQSKRISDLFLDLLSAVKVYLTPKGLRLEDNIQLVDEAMAPWKDECREHINALAIKCDELQETLVELKAEVNDIDTDDLDSRITELEDNDDDIDVEGAVETFLDSYKGQQCISGAIDEVIDKEAIARDAADIVKDDIEWLLDDDGFRTVVKRIVQDEIKNALEVLVAHWAANED